MNCRGIAIFVGQDLRYALNLCGPLFPYVQTWIASFRYMREARTDAESDHEENL